MLHFPRKLLLCLGRNVSCFCNCKISQKHMHMYVHLLYMTQSYRASKLTLSMYWGPVDCDLSSPDGAIPLQRNWHTIAVMPVECTENKTKTAKHHWYSLFYYADVWLYNKKSILQFHDWTMYSMVKRSVHCPWKNVVNFL